MSDDNVLDFRERLPWWKRKRQPKSRPEVVTLLQRLLAQALQGKIQSVNISYTDKDGHYHGPECAPAPDYDPA